MLLEDVDPDLVLYAYDHIGYGDAPYEDECRAQLLIDGPHACSREHLGDDGRYSDVEVVDVARVLGADRLSPCPRSEALML